MAELEHCSSCYFPTSWLAVPLTGKKEYNHDSTIYTFGLPEGQSLNLPVCACILMKAPGKGRKEGGGKEGGGKEGGGKEGESEGGKPSRAANRTAATRRLASTRATNRSASVTAMRSRLLKAKGRAEAALAKRVSEESDPLP